MHGRCSLPPLHSSILVLTWSSCCVPLMQGADRRKAVPHGSSIPMADAAFRVLLGNKRPFHVSLFSRKKHGLNVPQSLL